MANTCLHYITNGCWRAIAWCTTTAFCRCGWVRAPPLHLYRDKIWTVWMRCAFLVFLLWFYCGANKKILFSKAGFGRLSLPLSHSRTVYLFSVYNAAIFSPIHSSFTMHSRALLVCTRARSRCLCTPHTDKQTNIDRDDRQRDREKERDSSTLQHTIRRRNGWLPFSFQINRYFSFSVFIDIIIYSQSSLPHASIEFVVVIWLVVLLFISTLCVFLS